MPSKSKLDYYGSWKGSSSLGGLSHCAQLSFSFGHQTTDTPWLTMRIKRLASLSVSPAVATACDWCQLARDRKKARVRSCRANQLFLRCTCSLSTLELPRSWRLQNFQLARSFNSILWVILIKQNRKILFSSLTFQKCPAAKTKHRGQSNRIFFGERTLVWVVVYLRHFPQMRL